LEEFLEVLIGGDEIEWKMMNFGLCGM